MELTTSPAVLIHGLLGWGKHKPFYGRGPNYWPIKHLDEINPNYILVDVGVVSSDHDRACEVFYQLIGGTVDYGEEHAKEKKHERYGATFKTALHPKWSEEHPVHLFGHSYGATTALELYQLICTDFFKVGSNYKWVKSIVSIAGPLSGATMSHMCGLDDDLTVKAGSVNHLLSMAISFIWRLQQTFPVLEELYPLRINQWVKYCTWSSVFSVNTTPLKTADTAFHCLLPSSRFLRNSQLVHMDKVHLFSIVSRDDESTSLHIVDVLGLLGVVLLWRRKKHKWLLMLIAIGLFQRLRSRDIAKIPFLMTHALRWHANTTSKPLYDGYDQDKWAANDGIVNTYSMLCARYCETYPAQGDTLKQNMSRVASHVSIDMNEDNHGLPKGQWHVYRVAKNHFCGTAGDADAKELYLKLFRLLNTAVQV
ncbi:hypothetical protein THRCLA_01159 [Thraustotheca clavata]|uniref:Lipase-like C-terminal domain-containing protein n=1 Tax=Thraustotheca clavata TaxID=74557 RepID=A0A1W0A9G8_9STRA|nr:hypothetical protein THRCLA_01159 [Thraustotheca clavata]